jgi:hypothetical protein
MGMRKFLDKLACGAAGNRWHARHLIIVESLRITVLSLSEPIMGPEKYPYHIDSALIVFTDNSE